MIIQQELGFFPHNLTELLSAFALISGGMFAFWKGYTNLVAKIDGVGTRANALEETGIHTKNRLDILENDRRDELRNRQEIRDRVTRLEKEVEQTNVLINSMKIEVLQGLNNLNQNLVHEAGRIRERIIRIETVQQIEKKVGIPLEENGY